MRLIASSARKSVTALAARSRSLSCGFAAERQRIRIVAIKLGDASTGPGLAEKLGIPGTVATLDSWQRSRSGRPGRPLTARPLPAALAGLVKRRCCEGRQRRGGRRGEGASRRREGRCPQRQGPTPEASAGSQGETCTKSQACTQGQGCTEGQGC